MEQEHGARSRGKGAQSMKPKANDDTFENLEVWHRGPPREIRLTFLPLAPCSLNHIRRPHPHSSS
jgi:hypothetical protein